MVFHKVEFSDEKHNKLLQKHMFSEECGHFDSSNIFFQ